MTKDIEYPFAIMTKGDVEMLERIMSAPADSADYAPLYSPYDDEDES